MAIFLFLMFCTVRNFENNLGSNTHIMCHVHRSHNSYQNFILSRSFWFGLVLKVDYLIIATITNLCAALKEEGEWSCRNFLHAFFFGFIKFSILLYWWYLFSLVSFFVFFIKYLFYFIFINVRFELDSTCLFRPIKKLHILCFLINLQILYWISTVGGFISLC